MTVPMTVREGERVRDVPTVYLVEQQGPGPYGHTLVKVTDTASVGKVHADARLDRLRHDTVGDWTVNGHTMVGRCFSREIIWERAADGTPTDVGWQMVRPEPVESQ